MIREYIIKVSGDKDEDVLEGFPEIVRCKECKYGIRSSEGVMLCYKIVYSNGYKKDDWFCADGERRAE